MARRERWGGGGEKEREKKHKVGGEMRKRGRRERSRGGRE